MARGVPRLACNWIVIDVLDLRLTPRAIGAQKSAGLVIILSARLQGIPTAISVRAIVAGVPIDRWRVKRELVLRHEVTATCFDLLDASRHPAAEHIRNCHPE